VADEPTTTRRALFETTFKTLTALNQKLECCKPEDRDALEREIAEQQGDVLDTPAGSLSQVQAKLELLFEGHLFGTDPESEYRRLVIEDLSDLIAEARELVGASA
jgi:hypothetical protein